MMLTDKHHFIFMTANCNQYLSMSSKPLMPPHPMYVHCHYQCHYVLHSKVQRNKGRNWVRKLKIIPNSRVLSKCLPFTPSILFRVYFPDYIVCQTHNEQQIQPLGRKGEWEITHSLALMTCRRIYLTVTLQRSKWLKNQFTVFLDPDSA